MRLDELRAAYGNFFDAGLLDWAYAQPLAAQTIPRSHLKAVKPKSSISHLYRVAKGELAKRSPRVFAKTPDLKDDPASDGNQIVELFCLQLFKKAGIDFLVAPAILANVKSSGAQNTRTHFVSFAPTDSDTDIFNLPLDTTSGDTLKLAISAYSVILIARLMVDDADSNTSNNRFEPKHELLFGIDFDPALDLTNTTVPGQIMRDWPHIIEPKAHLGDNAFALSDIIKHTQTPALDMDILKDTILAFCAIPDTEVKALLGEFTKKFNEPIYVQKLQHVADGFLIARHTLQRMVTASPHRNQFLSIASNP